MFLHLKENDVRLLSMLKKYLAILSFGEWIILNCTLTSKKQWILKESPTHYSRAERGKIFEKDLTDDSDL